MHVLRLKLREHTLDAVRLTRHHALAPRYNTLMKLIFILSTATIVWYMRKHKVVSQTYSKEEETFKVIYLLVPTLLLALLVNHEFTAIEVRAREAPAVR